VLVGTGVSVGVGGGVAVLVGGRVADGCGEAVRVGVVLGNAAAVFVAGAGVSVTCGVAGSPQADNHRIHPIRIRNDLFLVIFLP
jgi:hypothetical protein